MKLTETVAPLPMIRKTPYFRSCESPVSSFTKNIKYPDRNKGNQHNSNIAAEAMTVQDKHRPCQDGNVFSHTASRRKIIPTLSRAQRWMSVQQYACNDTESCHDKQRCVTMNSSVCTRSLDFLDLCSTVLRDKNKGFTW